MELLTSTLLDNVKQLLNLKVGDAGRLEHIKSSLEENKTLYSSDMNYIRSLIEHHIVNPEILDETVKQNENTKLQSENIKLKNEIAKLQVKSYQSNPILPKVQSSLGNKVSIICSIIGVISVILLFVSYMSISNERTENINEKLTYAVFDVLDVCVNTIDLAVIVSCDKDISGLVKTCKDNNIKECDVKIEEYYNTRDSRITQFCEQLRKYGNDIFAEYGPSEEYSDFIKNNNDSLSYCRK